MRADEQLKSGDLDATLAALQAEIRAGAADPKLRVFLFQLLSVMGDWKRAIAQLKLCAELDPAALAMAQTYREGIICEVYRERVFSGEKAPLIFGAPQAWIALLTQALEVQATGRADDAAALREKAFDAAPAVSGTLNGQPFEWIADADMRLGPVLEAVVNGKYFWIPFNRIAKIEAENPKDLRDCVWTPVTLTLTNGGEVVALIPTRYAQTATRGDDAQRLARATVWTDAGAGCFTGLGQRILATDAGDVALMDLRSLVMVQSDADPATGSDSVRPQSAPAAFDEGA